MADEESLRECAGSSGRRLKVLVLDEAIPYPPNSGKPARSWNLLRRLARRHHICLLCYGRQDSLAAAAVQKAGITLHLVEPQSKPMGWVFCLQLLFNLFSSFPFSVAKHYSARFQRTFLTILNQGHWDLIHCEWTPYARFVANVPEVPVLIATHNVESQIWARRALHAGNSFAKLFLKTQEWKMRRFEKRALLRASAATVVSSLELSTVRKWGVTNVNLVPNGVDLDMWSPIPEVEHEDELLFLASLDWYPNLDALDYFVRHILPAVRARRPRVTLRIVGRGPAKAVAGQYSDLPGIDFVGEVEEVRSHVDRATVIVVPLRIGGGSRIKILEALAAGKAVISTAIGAEGLDVVSGEHLLIADSPATFAEGIESLLASTELRRRLSSNGRRLVENLYDWNQIANRLESVWYSVSERHQAALRRDPLSPSEFGVSQ